MIHVDSHVHDYNKFRFDLYHSNTCSMCCTKRSATSLQDLNSTEHDPILSTSELGMSRTSKKRSAPTVNEFNDYPAKRQKANDYGIAPSPTSHARPLNKTSLWDRLPAELRITILRDIIEDLSRPLPQPNPLRKTSKMRAIRYLMSFVCHQDFVATLAQRRTALEKELHGHAAEGLDRLTRALGNINNQIGYEKTIESYMHAVLCCRLRAP